MTEEQVQTLEEVVRSHGFKRFSFHVYTGEGGFRIYSRDQQETAVLVSIYNKSFSKCVGLVVYSHDIEISSTSANWAKEMLRKEWTRVEIDSCARMLNELGEDL